MKKGVFLLAFVALAVLLVDGAALAGALPGTEGDDELMGWDGGEDQDQLHGGPGADLLIGTSDDHLYCGEGHDRYIRDATDKGTVHVAAPCDEEDPGEVAVLD